MATGFMAGAIVSKMTMDTTKWNASIKGVKKDETGLKGMSGRLTPNFKKIGTAMTLAGAAVIASLKGMTNQFIETGDWIDKMSKRTGISAEALSELAHVAELGGASLDNVERGVKKMAKSISDASDGLETYQRAFRKIGINVEELKKLSPEKQFLAISEAIAGMEDPTLRAAVAQDIFGRAGTTLLPMMSDGVEAFQDLRREAHDLGIVYDTELAAAAAKLKDDKTRLNSAMKGLSNTLIVTLVPAITDFTVKLTDVVKKVVDWAKENPKLISTIMKIVGGMGILLTTLGPVVVILPKIIGLVLGLGKAFTFLALNPVGILIVALAALTIGFLKVKSAQDKAKKSAQQYAEITERLDKKLLGIAERAGLTADEFENLKKKYNNNTNALVKAIRAGKEGVALQESMISTGKENVEIQEKQTEAQEFNLGSLEALTKGYGEVKEKAKDWTDYIKDLGIKTVEEKSDRVTELEGYVDDLTAAYDAGVISLEDYRQATDEARAEIEDLSSEIVDTAIPAARDLIDVMASAPGEMAQSEIANFPATIAVKAKEGARKVKSIWGDMTDGMKTQWANMWSSFLKGELSFKSFGEAFKQMAKNILSQFADMVGQMISKWTIDFIQNTLISGTKGAVDTIVGTFKDVTDGALNLAKGFSPTGAIATGIGAAVGTFLGGLIGPPGAGQRDTQMIKDNTWLTANVLKTNVVKNLDAIKWALWNIKPYQKQIAGNSEEMKKSLWNVNEKLGRIRKALDAPPTTTGTETAGQGSGAGTTVNINRIQNEVNLNGLIITDRDYARRLLPEILGALRQRAMKKRLQEILGIA